MASVLQVQKHIQLLEHILNKDVLFVLHEDGSGCFETVFDAEEYQQFDNQSELNTIISTRNLNKIDSNE